MVERGEVQRLLAEADEPLGVARELARQQLERDVTIEARVVRPVHVAHAARTQAIDDDVRPERGAAIQQGRAPGLGPCAPVRRQAGAAPRQSNGRAAADARRSGVRSGRVLRNHVEMSPRFRISRPPGSPASRPRSRWPSCSPAAPPSEAPPSRR